MTDHTGVAALCGTLAAHSRHVRQGETIDDDCRSAFSAYMRKRRSAQRVIRPETSCLNCATSFSPKRSDNGGYCSANCSSAHGQKLRRGPIVPRPCAWCSAVFTPKHRDAEVCSRECRHAITTLKRHDLTVDEYAAMLRAQGEACAICRTALGVDRRDRHIDHDHESGHVRGILCPHCNLMLGHAKDRAHVLIRAAEYLDGRTP